MAKIIGIAALAVLFFLISLIYGLIKRAMMSPEQKRLESLMIERSINEGGKDILRSALKEGKSVLPYIDGDYNSEQLEQIIMGIKEGLAIENYAKPDIPAEQMRTIRQELKKG